MNNLVIMKDRQAVTDSLKVAESFDKKHKNVLQNIQNLAAENSATKKMFVESTYVNRGKEYPMIYMNRDGFTLLAMGFTGKKALDFKLKYIQAFNEMEKRIRQPKSERLEIMRKNSATKRAGVLYKIAMATDSNISRQKLLHKAAEALTGEKLVPVMQDKYYSVEEVGQQLNLTTDLIDEIANQIHLKAEYSGQNQYGSWINSDIPEWFYTKQGIELIDMYKFIARKNHER
ncbi:Rha family transcriptional regulator [Lactobacillus isalae]|uniref:Rha family transcriptional regulator n=1 Tax=Lactobacillus isalae TaxID=2993455 RepID=UPI0024A823FD|nr:Rha family transcriptional regulator [Lactobacillus isalae]